MKTKMGAVVLAGAFFITAIPMMAIAGPGGKMNRQTLHIKTQSQSMQRISTQHRLRDGSSQEFPKAASEAMPKKGNTYGPGYGTGNDGIGPKDGTGYGAPSKR